MKRLVICCDGTWNTPDQKDRGVMRPTNVVKIARMVRPQTADGVEQQVYYDLGVGTGDFIDRIFGGMFGVGLRHNVLEAYQFLSENYCAGDEVWLFGFSRGAYTVRRVVGMLRKCGMLPGNLDRQTRAAAITEGYGIFVRRERADQGGADSQAALDFREKYGAPRIPVTFVGVWDTVGAYGIGGMLGQLAGKARFHDSKLSSDVRHACHAVAIDEQRTAFRPALWEQTPNGKDKGQVIEQSWFAGVHSNIGGGYQDSGLSDLALHWMAARAEARGLGLDEHWHVRLAPDVFGELRESRTGIYRLLGKAVRDIGVQANGFERLHQAPHDRLQRDPAPYEPENLLAYLNSQQTRFDFSEPGL